MLIYTLKGICTDATVRIGSKIGQYHARTNGVRRVDYFLAGRSSESKVCSQHIHLTDYLLNFLENMIIKPRNRRLCAKISFLPKVALAAWPPQTRSVCAN